MSKFINPKQITKQRIKSQEILSYFMLALLILILLALGTWQLKRLAEKNNFIQAIEYNIAAPANIIASFDEKIKLYDKISIKGQFLKGQDIFLYGRRSSLPEKDGYYWLSPFKTINQEIILVSRAWLPQSLKTQLITNPYQTHDQLEEITGFVLAGEKRNFLVPENDYQNHIWFNIDLKMAKKLLNLTSDQFYLMQIENKQLPIGAKMLSGENLSKIRNDHLEYAITWYSLAVSLLIIFFIHRRRK